MPVDPQQQLQRLWPIFHHSPVAMAVVNGLGQMRQVNPKVIQLLMPLAMALNLPGDNILDVLTGYLPDVGQTITRFGSDSGVIIDQELYRIRFQIGESLIERHFSLSIEKVSPDSLLIYMLDVTDFLIKANALRQQL